MKHVIIMSTYPNKKTLNKIEIQLVKSKHVECVNISKISSIYTWKGKVENTHEYLAFFKTTQKNKKKLKEKIKTTHPYQVPEIAEIDVNSINRSYLKWLVESTL